MGWLFGKSKVHDGYIVDKKGKKVQIYKVTERYTEGNGETSRKTYTVDANGNVVHR